PHCTPLDGPGHRPSHNGANLPTVAPFLYILRSSTLPAPSIASVSPPSPPRALSLLFFVLLLFFLPPFLLP
ncbi:MAG: hypothetical protein FE78DRAFT_148666, partial [Acidomyces sp. 'richmondensis']